MRRATTILIGILLGALAAGLGVGFFLKKANRDREELAAQVEATVREANEARQTAIADANRKLQAANAEVGKAQAIIKGLQEERELLLKAVPLAQPSGRSLKGWNDVVALDLGVAMKYPENSGVETNDEQALTLVKTSAGSSGDGRWFSLIPYDGDLEQELLSSLATSTPLSYIVNGRILTGVKGSLADQSGTIFVLRVRYGGQTTHLMWIRDQGSGSNLPLITNLLASLRFQT